MSLNLPLRQRRRRGMTLSHHGKALKRPMTLKLTQVMRKPTQVMRHPMGIPNERHESVRPAEFLLLPDIEFFRALSTGMLPLDVAPFYALLAAIIQAVCRRQAYSTVIASAQLVCAFEHLGF